jgi:aminoglycoside 6-adenylyltransferase
MSTDPETLVSSIAAWAEANANVLALIMTGSRVRPGAVVDEFSDIDIEIIARDPGALITDDGWLSSFGRVWVYLPLSEGQPYPTRLVFYEGGMKVDFSLCGVERVREMAGAKALDDLYERGYRVLVDKEGMTSGLPAPSGTFPAKRLPDQEEFSAIVTEFWFEAAHIPRYLLRDELWVVKFRDWTMKELLLKMLEWHAVARSDAPVDVWHIGSHLKEWLDVVTREEIGGIFARFDARSSWDGLLATTALFRRVAAETAAALGLTYPAEMDADVSGYIATFEQRIARSPLPSTDG